MNAKSFFELFKTAAKEWGEDKASRLGAALAYYSIFSMAPLLLVAISVAGIFLGGQESARAQIIDSLSSVIGAEAGRQVGEMIQGANKQGGGLIASIVGVGTLLLGASGVFGALQDALNTIWEVQPKPGQGIVATLKARFLSLTMVVGTGFLLLVSLLLTSALNAVVNSMSHLLPMSGVLLQLVTFVVTFVVITLLFAMIYKVLPDVDIEWRDVSIGSAITALLFLLGQAALSWYLGTQSTQSVYGAAGSLVVLLLYVYYSAQIVFFGAEFTQVYANRYGSHIKPAENAMAMTEEMRAHQGMTRAGAGAPVTGASVSRRPDGSPIISEHEKPSAFGARRHANSRNNENLSDIANVLAGLGLIMILKKLRGRKGTE